MAGVSQTWTFFEDAWHAGNVRMIGPRTHASWLGSAVFDGARAFEGVTPDLDRHCARVNASAERLGMKPVVSVGRWVELVREGLRRFAPDAQLYIRPMYWPEHDGPLSIVPDPDSTRYCLCLYEAPLPEPTGFSVTLSPFRRPSFETMPVDAKAGCLYPNNARALREALSRGFENCLLRDGLANVAELASANIFMAKGGELLTPAPNGTFLDGITRQRVIGLLRAAGVPVRETTLRYEDFLAADEIFSTGNYSKVAPVTRIDTRPIEPGPHFRRARELYWSFAHG
jgi:branched-chain amino acid aminotransferase